MGSVLLAERRINWRYWKMGTVLSFSPRENHPIYSTHHHRGSGTNMSTSSSADFSLNNYAYEQMNNVKNRENCTKTNIISNNNGSSLVLFGSSTNSNIMNNNLTTTNGCSMEERQSDSARILSEKNAIEKNLKKHSLFINALSWKRLSSSHGKKKLESYNTKNKAANLSTSSFRPPALTDTVHPHPMVVSNDKNKNYQQHIQFASSNNNLNNNLNINHVKDNLHSQSNIYFSPGPKGLLALDLQNSNNANLQHHQHVEKLGPKLPLQLPLGMHSSAMHHHQHHQQQQQQQQLHYRPGPRKTIIQVSMKNRDKLCIYNLTLLDIAWRRHTELCKLYRSRRVKAKEAEGARWDDSIGRKLNFTE